MSKFEVFFAFYGLILGLAVTALLNGLIAVIQARRLKALGPQTILLGTVVLLALSITWLDALARYREVELALADLAAPFLTAVFYYLAAGLTLPARPDEWTRIDDHYAEQKSTVAGLLLAAEFVVKLTLLPKDAQLWQSDRAAFWIWSVGSTVAIMGLLLALLLARGRRLNLVVLVLLVLVYLVPYWQTLAP